MARKGIDRAFVTERAVRAERGIIASMRAGQGAGKALCGTNAVEARLADSRLTAGQKEAVRTVLLSDDPVVGVQGHAGSGKTTMLREVKGLLGGRRIQGLAPSAAAARVLGREAGIPSTTLQWFLTRYGEIADGEQLDRAWADYRGTVLAVDECSMIDTARMEALLRIAGRLGVARVALVGDTAQLRAVDAGQPFRLLQKAGMRTATMDEVLRQRDPALLASVMHAREGEAGAAIRGLGERRVREVEREELGAEAARCWLALSPENRAETAIMAPTHEIRRQTNEAVRVGLAEEGTLHGRALEIDRLVNRRLTRALAAELASYEPGDTVVFHRDVFGCRKDDICTVTGRADGKVVLAHADGGERGFRPSGNAATYLGLYDTERIELRAGDRIRWTRNRKAPPPRAGHPPQPDLVNGGEAEIVEIGYKRVRFRDGDREFSLALKDPQLRHLDHAWCTTVHAAQGKTVRAAIAVLDAGGAADRELFHVEISRVTDEFLLLTDDREALIELIETRVGGEEGALEALGLDPAATSDVDAGLFDALAKDWRALERRAAETNAIPFFVPGYREVMARAATLAATGDLPPDLRRLVDRMLAEHRKHLAHDREVQDLVTRIQEHWRAWPELGWAAEAQGVDELPEHAAWRADGAALADAGRGRLAAQGEERRHLEAMPGVDLAGAVAELERTRLLDDARRFERLWGDLRARAMSNGVPELLGEGYAEAEALGERLATVDGLDARGRNAVAAWRDVHAAQTALADAVRALPQRVAEWRERRAELALDEVGAADPAGPARQAWREDGQGLETMGRHMLRPEDAHAPYLDAAPGARESVRRAAAEVEKALEDDRWEGFAWLAREVEQEERKTGTEPYHLPRYGDMIAEAQALAGRPGLSEDERAVVGSLLRYDADAARLCGEIRNWQGRAAALQDDRPPPDAALETLTGWRERAEAQLDESRAMRAEDGPHAPHLTAMPRERKALDGAVRKLDAAAAAVEIAETGWLMKSGLGFEERTGGMAYDAPIHDALMERVRSLEARGKLPKKWRETVDNVLGYDEWCGRDRRRVGAFLDAAGEVENARDDLEAEARMRSMPAERLADWEDLREKAVSVVHKAKALVEEIPERELTAHLAAFGAGPDGIEERQEKIREQIARDVQARAAAEEERRAAEQALIAEIAEIGRIGADRIRAAAKQADVGPEREAETRRERPPVHDTTQPPARAAPEADRAADRLDACLERRDRLLERAERKFGDNRPVVDLGRRHSGWRREADRAIEAGRASLGDERHGPGLDASGSRDRIERAVDRLERAAVLDRLPARIAAGWEKLEDRIRETGRHRFFVPEHKMLCEQMSHVRHRVGDTATRQFVDGELAMREGMSGKAKRLDDVAGRLRDCVGERTEAEARDRPTVQQVGYSGWRHRAGSAVADAKTILAGEKEYALHFDHNPGLRKTLETLSAALERPLREESAEWNSIRSERERAETERQRGQDQGISW